MAFMCAWTYEKKAQKYITMASVMKTIMCPIRQPRKQYVREIQIIIFWGFF